MDSRSRERSDSQPATTMAEDRRLESQSLCVNNCGFFGTPATLNLCSKCFLHSSAVNIAVTVTAPPADARGTPSDPVQAAEEGASTKSTAANRCSACRRKVGITGFVCRCGDTFCGVHRYPEKHMCGYNFKAEGKEAIARANPVVRAEKLEKI